MEAGKRLTCVYQRDQVQAAAGGEVRLYQVLPPPGSPSGLLQPTHPAPHTSTPGDSPEICQGKWKVTN